MSDEIEELRLLATFEKSEAFFTHLRTILASDLFNNDPITDAENEAFKHLCIICDEYQEQSYLLDPWLEQIVAPPVEALRKHVTKVIIENYKGVPSIRVSRLSLVIYQIIKTRGYKTIVPFFPHQVSDLGIAIAYMQYLEVAERIFWPTRYIVLLWLSLICRLPFDLANFDAEGMEQNSTAQVVEDIGRQYLDKAGLEKDGAALLLARLYSRQDTCMRLSSFLSWATPTFIASSDLFKAVGVLQVLNELLKSAGMEQIGVYVRQMLELGQRLPHNAALAAHTIIRKSVVKLFGRVALKLLPPARSLPIQARTLDGKTISINEGFADDVDDEIDIPSEIEGVIDDLLIALRDRDTTIRWSAAKYMARLGSRVPVFMVDQLLDAVIDIYHLHYVDGEELATTAEPSWHGSTLACAEFARQGLISATKLEHTIHWALKALFFDVRKGTHSIGSNVRDAACYFFWAIARTHDVEMIKPYSTTLARSLVTLALFDREVHIRRAASAAFQENVGRMGLFPHGIDVLRATDFYGVGIRRNAFLVATPQVSQYLVYRDHLLRHLLQTTLRHWDPAMRSIGSQALREICLQDVDSIVPSIIGQLRGYLRSNDSNDVHGAVLGLREIAEGLRQKEDDKTAALTRAEIFEMVSLLSENSLKGYRNDLILEASCLLIASSLSEKALLRHPDLGVKLQPHWKMILDLSLKHRNDTVQISATHVVDALSVLRSSEDYING